MKTTTKNLQKLEIALIALILIGGSFFITFAAKKLTKMTATISASQADLLRMSTLHVGNPESRGSAVYISDNLALSAAHVCVDIDKQKTVITDYNGGTTKVVDFDLDEQSDICVIKLANIPNELPERELANRSFFLLGQTIITAGYPGGMFYSIQSATVKAIQVINVRGSDAPKYITLIDTYVAPGGSGSGAFNEKGDIIGIVIVSNAVFSISGMVPLEDIHRFLKGSELGRALVN